MFALLRPAVVLFGILTLITGLVYPLLVTGLAQLFFKDAANGSLITVQGKTVGSALLGQSFTRPEYFWSRPSATGPQANNGAASGGSNLAGSNPVLLQAVKDRVEALQKADPTNPKPVPVDLVTASASGLDPHISLAAAEYQASRVARARQRTPAEVQTIIQRHAEHPLLGIFGEPRVNVLALNLALDATKP